MDGAGTRATLARAATGDRAAADELLTDLYDDLRRLAQHMMNDERPGHPLQATALLHEAYVRVVGGDGVPPATREAFFCAAARAMRRILVDESRRRDAAKRGGDVWTRLADSALESVAARPDTRFLEIEEALIELEHLDDRQCRVVELRFFAGLTAERTAEILGVTERTVYREWRSAQAWLRARLGG